MQSAIQLRGLNDHVVQVTHLPPPSPPPRAGPVSPAHGVADVGASRAGGAAGAPGAHGTHLAHQQRVVAVQRWAHAQPLSPQQHLVLERGARPIQHGHLHWTHDTGE